jgi:O-antigen ligase
MAARSGGIRLLLPAALACAAILGIVAVIQPLVAIGIAVAIVFVYIVFSNLAVGFAALAFLSFLDTLPTSSGLSIAKAAGLLLAVAWIARISLSGRGERDFFAEFPHLTWVLIVFLAWAAMTLLWARSLGTGVSALGRYAPDILLLPIAYSAVRTRRDLMLVVGAIVGGALLAACFGVLQPPNPSVIEESSRASGTVGDPNELAAFLLVGLALGAAFAVGKGHSPLLRMIAACAIPLCAAGIFLSLSRGGLIALGVLMLAGTVLAGRWRIGITLIMLAVVAGGLLYFTQLAPLPARERVSHADGGSGRSDLWTIGLRMTKAHPLTGVGVGNFQVVSADYVLQPGTLIRADLIFSSAPKVTHNTYLEIAAENGIPGLLAFVAVLVSCLAAALKAARLWAVRGERPMEALARGILLGTIGMLVADFFISDMYTKLLWVMLALCCASLGVARAEDAKAPTEPAAPASEEPNPARGGPSGLAPTPAPSPL